MANEWSEAALVAEFIDGFLTTAGDQFQQLGEFGQVEGYELEFPGQWRKVGEELIAIRDDWRLRRRGDELQ